MTAQDLEELLKTKTYRYPDTRSLQEIIDSIVEDLRSGGRKMEITRIFTENTSWLGKTVTVLDAKNQPKPVVTQGGHLESVYDLKVEYFDPQEVKNF